MKRAEGSSARRSKARLSNEVSPTRMYEESVKFIEGTKEPGSGNKRGKYTSRKRKPSIRKTEVLAS